MHHDDGSFEPTTCSSQYTCQWNLPEYREFSGKHSYKVNCQLCFIGLGSQSDELEGRERRNGKESV
jgi:hypothetical protein